MAIDWTASMEQTFEYYKVDPGTWRDTELLDAVESCDITRDLEADTLGSASLKVKETFPETYIRVYLIAKQNGVTEKVPLGTFLAQSPSSSYDGMRSTATVDAYTPLIELKENKPPLGYYMQKNMNIMTEAYTLTRNYARAPIVEAVSEEIIQDDFVANTDDTWMTFLTDFIANAKFYYDLDEMGRIIFSPIQETASLQPVWTFDDSNSSILQPELDTDHDIYGIPNVVEVIYSNSNYQLSARAVNDDPNSAVSTVNRGREITERVENPSISGVPTQEMLEEYANRYLKEASTLEYTISYKHGYCPVRVGDAVRLNYKRAGLTGVKAKVISQRITCGEGCQVSETAVYTKKYWG